jgi:hypothetical protein
VDVLHGDGAGGVLHRDCRRQYNRSEQGDKPGCTLWRSRLRLGVLPRCLVWRESRSAVKE